MAYVGSLEHVNICGAAVEFGFPYKSQGTGIRSPIQLYTNLFMKIFDESTEESGFQSLSKHKALFVQMKNHNGAVYALFDKKYSSFAVLESRSSVDFKPYHVSPRFDIINDDRVSVMRIRAWLANHRFEVGLGESSARNKKPLTAECFTEYKTGEPCRRNIDQKIHDQQSLAFKGVTEVRYQTLEIRMSEKSENRGSMNEYTKTLGKLEVGMFFDLVCKIAPLNLCIKKHRVAEKRKKRSFCPKKSYPRISVWQKNHSPRNKNREALEDACSARFPLLSLTSSACLPRSTHGQNTDTHSEMRPTCWCSENLSYLLIRGSPPSAANRNVDKVGPKKEWGG
ncbi:hypothetical protein ACLOJK_041587 [Asimina triloba]